MPSFNISSGGYSPAFGGIPQLPNPVSTAGEALSGDISNLPSLLQLITSIDTAQEGQLLNNYAAAIPNYANLTKSASDTTGQELEGHLPQDVINQLSQQAAERGIATGMPGGDNSNAAYLRALGLTSLGEQQTGMQNLATMTQTAPVAPLFNPASLLVTPEQQQSAGAAQSIYSAAPNPAAAAQKAMQTASAVGGGSSMPWWAQGAGMPVSLGPGSYSTGAGVWHTPAAAS